MLVECNQEIVPSIVISSPIIIQVIPKEIPNLVFGIISIMNYVWLVFSWFCKSF